MIPNPTSPQSIDLRSNPPNLARGVPSPKSSCLIPSPQAHHAGSLTGGIESKGREEGKRDVQVCGRPAVAAEEREEGCGDAGEEEDERGHPEPHGRRRQRPRRATPAAAASRSLSLDRSVGEGDATGAAGEGDGGGGAAVSHVTCVLLDRNNSFTGSRWTCKEILTWAWRGKTLWAFGPGMVSHFVAVDYFIYLYIISFWDV